MLIPIGFVIQLCATVFAAGMGYQSLRDIKERQKEDRDKNEKALKEAVEKRDKDIKEIHEKHERELKEVRNETKADVNLLRSEHAKTLSDVRAESQAGREAIRLEMSTMIQTTAEVRAERMSQFFKDFEKLEVETVRGFGDIKSIINEVAGRVNALYTEMRDMSWKVKNLEDDMEEAGNAKRSGKSAPRMDAVSAPPYGGRPDIARDSGPSFDPQAGRHGKVTR